MNKKYIIIFLFSTILALESNAQTLFTGKVLDAKTQEAIPFASIALTENNIGTCTSVNGNFKLEVPDSILPCNICISSISYKTTVLPLDEENRQQNIYLSKKIYSIDAVLIKGKKISSKKILKEAINNISKFYCKQQQQTNRTLKVAHYENSKCLYRSKAILSLTEPSYIKDKYSPYDNYVEKVVIIEQTETDKIELTKEFSLNRFINVFDYPCDILKTNPSRYIKYSTKTFHEHTYKFSEDSLINGNKCYVIEATFNDSLIKGMKYINKDIYFITKENNILIAYKNITYFNNFRKVNSTTSLDETNISYLKTTNGYIAENFKFNGYIRRKDEHGKTKKVSTFLTLNLDNYNFIDN